MILFENGVQGLSDTKWQGAAGQAHRLVGVDHRSEPGLIKVHQKLTKDSGSTIGELCKVSVPVSDGSSLWFSSETGKIWREVNGVYTLINFTIPGLSFPISSAEDTGKSISVATQVEIPQAICFRPNGLIMYVLCNAKVSGNNGEIFQYTLTTPFDVSTATYASLTKLVDVNGNSMAFSSDGTLVYIGEDGGTTSVIAYTMSTPWNISTAGAAGATLNFSAQGSRAFALNFNSAGTKMVIFDIGTNEVNQYNLATAWLINTATFATRFDLLPSLSGGCMSPDGLTMFAQKSDSEIVEYRLTVSYDVSTALISGRTFSTGSGKTFALAAAPDGSGFYVGNQSTPETIFQYKISAILPDLNTTVLSAEEYSVFDGLDGPDLDTLNNERLQYIYFATKNWLFRIPVTEIGTAGWPKFEYLTLFKNSDDKYHPMKKQNNTLFIGDKYCLASVNEFGVIVKETEFNVLAPEQITTLGSIDTDLLVGTKEPRKASVKRWDTEALSWYAEDSVEESEIYAFLPDDNYTYVIAGDFGRIYFYDGEKMELETRVPGQYGISGRSKVNSDAVAFFSVPVFGVSNLQGNPSWQGVYSYGRFSKDYNVTMDLSFPLSCNVFEGVEIGSILVRNFDLMVSWKSANSAGIDRLDWNKKYESAFIESMVLNGAKDRSMLKNIDNFLVDYYKLPANTGIEFSVSNNYKGFHDIETEQRINDKLNQVRAKATQKELGAVEVMVEFNVDGNQGPEIENVHVNFEGEAI